MHIEKIKQYNRRIAEVVDGATTGLSNPQPIPIPRPRTDGFEGFALNDEVHAKQIDIVSDLLKKDGWIKKFSQEYVDGRISEIVSQNVGSPDNSGIESKFLSLVQECEAFDTETTVFIPLEGIALKVPELILGKIRLVSVTPEYLSDLRKNATLISKDTLGTEENKEMALSIANGMIDQFQGSVCAERKVVAESTRAREIVREELRLTVAILNFLADALVPKYFNARVGLKGEFFRGQRFELARENDSFKWQQLVTGPLGGLTIDEKALKLIRELKIQELAELVTQDEFEAEKTFEGTILTAIHFHSHSRELPDPADKLLSLMTAVESFFETSQKSISNTIASGCALVLCKSLEDRLKLRSLVSKLYGLRSSISHFGEGKVIGSDLAQFSLISWQLICFAIEIRDRFKNKKEFNQWIEKLGFGLPNESEILKFKK